MTTLPTLTKYSGAIPNKATMDKNTFANAVHPYLNWWNDYIPTLEEWATNLQTLSSELQTLATDTEGFRNDAETFKNDAESAKQGAETAETGAIQAKNDAQAIADGITAQLPEGTISDNTVGTDTTWSSSKIQQELLASGEFNTYSVVTSNKTIVAKEFCYVDTTAGEVIITLPTNPNDNDIVGFVDFKSNFDNNRLIVARNGKNIMGLAEDLEVTSKNIAFKLIYKNNDWRIV